MMYESYARGRDMDKNLADPSSGEFTVKVLGHKYPSCRGVLMEAPCAVHAFFDF